MRAEEHPEALIDRATRGALDPDAQATLDRHLAICPECAEQVALAPRFERELAPQPRDEILDQRVRQAPESAYDPEFFEAFATDAGWRVGR